ncbi:hypothetical protein J6590_033202 [Homalodisca vitripennis]|nr:hypothetical protein J6590_033202 [Homalodisca vitripennis]
MSVTLMSLLYWMEFAETGRQVSGCNGQHCVLLGSHLHYREISLTSINTRSRDIENDFTLNAASSLSARVPEGECLEGVGQAGSGCRTTDTRNCRFPISGECPHSSTPRRSLIKVGSVTCPEPASRSSKSASNR